MKLDSDRGLQGSGTLVIALFSHIEVYPPSLNALYHLAPMFDKVYILVRNVWASNWQYPHNVQIVTSGKFVPLEKVGSNNLVAKVRAYLVFGVALRRLCKSKKPSAVLLYDAAAFSLFHLFVPRHMRSRKMIVWYHNHDVSVEEEVGKFSLMRLMKKLEIHYFRRADIFSLPNQVRLKYFPISDLRSSPFVIPNYPSSFFFGKWFRTGQVCDDNLRLIFQGHIAQSNRIEDFINILSNTVAGRKVELHLAGPIHVEYENTIVVLAKTLGVQDRVFIYGRLPYGELPALTSRCHVGLAIYGFHNTMVRTMSTASNKIFEYASVGLPVLVNDRPDLKDEFEKYPWIQFIGVERQTIVSALETITANYSYFSQAARSDFELKLNFETVFQPVKKVLREKLTFEQW